MENDKIIWREFFPILPKNCLSWFLLISVQYSSKNQCGTPSYAKYTHPEGPFQIRYLKLRKKVEKGCDVPWIAVGSSSNECAEFPMQINEEDDVEKEFLLDLKKSWNYPAPTFNFDTSKSFCTAFLEKCNVLEVDTNYQRYLRTG